MEDGWVEWIGGTCPVTADTAVEVKIRDGYKSARCKADQWVWEHYGDDFDIIAYRVVK